MCQTKNTGKNPGCYRGCNLCERNFNSNKKEQVVNILSKEFELMCFVKDTKVMCGFCSLEQVNQKFGEVFIKHCLYEKKILFLDKKNGGLDWSDFGKQYMAI